MTRFFKFAFILISVALFAACGDKNSSTQQTNASAAENIDNLIASKDFDKAIAALKERPLSDVKAEGMLLKVYVERGDYYVGSGNLESGLHSYWEALNVKSDFDEARVKIKDSLPQITEQFQADPTNETAKQLLVDTHLNYAIFLEHRANHLGMKQRMPDALRHYRRVLELDPENDKAQAEIAQIEGIYKSLNRAVPEGVAE